MAGAQVGITIDDERVQRAMRKLTAAALDLSKPMEEIGAALVTSTQQRFEDEQSPEGEAWEALSPATQLRKVAGKPRGGAHILRVKAILYKSITYLASRFETAVGSIQTYAAIQQLGGTDEMAPGPAAVSARPYLGASADDETEIGAILIDHFGTALA